MATVTTNYQSHAPVITASKTDRVISILQWTYGLLPIAAGADKFMHILTDWNKYLAPIVTDVIPMSPNAFMNIVGLIEIVAGVIVFFRPRLGSLIVTFWLLGIAVNLLFTGQYYDVAVRDTVIAIGAFSLFTLLDERRNAS